MSGVLTVLLAIAGLAWPTATASGKGRRIVELPFSDGSDVDSTTAVGGAHESVLVLMRYRVEQDRRQAFISHMEQVEQSRQRTGARTWHLYEDHDAPGTFVEAFTVGSWQEHLSQHANRDTEYDDELLAAARAFSLEAPAVEHLIAVARPRLRSPHPRK